MVMINGHSGKNQQKRKENSMGVSGDSLDGDGGSIPCGINQVQILAPILRSL